MGTRLCTDDVYKGSPQPIGCKGLRVSACLTTDWYRLLLKTQVETHKDSQTDGREVVLVCRSKWMQMEQHKDEHAAESIESIDYIILTSPVEVM